MKRMPESVPLCLFVAFIVALVTTRSPLLLILLGAPAALPLLAKASSRCLLIRRTLWLVPLSGLAILLRCFGHAPSSGSDLCVPLLRVTGAAAWSTWLSVELTPRELESALRTLRFPFALVELLAQTRRFSGQLAHTCLDAWNAARLRGGVCSARASARTAGLVAGVIVVRAFDRAENVAIALSLRGALIAASAPVRLGPIELEELG